MIESAAAVAAQFLVDSELALWGDVGDDELETDNWYTTYNRLPENQYQWIMVKDLTEELVAKPVRQRREWESYYSVQFLIRGDRDYSGRRKGKGIVDVLDVLYNAVVTWDGVTYRIQGFNKTSALMFVQTLERDDMQLYSVNGNLTIWET